MTFNSRWYSKAVDTWEMFILVTRPCKTIAVVASRDFPEDKRKHNAWTEYMYPVQRKGTGTSPPDTVHISMQVTATETGFHTNKTYYSRFSQHRPHPSALLFIFTQFNSSNDFTQERHPASSKAQNTLPLSRRRDHDTRWNNATLSVYWCMNQYQSWREGARSLSSTFLG